MFLERKDLFLLFISVILLININQSNGSRTRDRMYQDINGAGCFRRMNGTHQFGCSSDRRGSTGVVYFIEDSDDIVALLNAGTASSYIPIMSVEKLTRNNVNLLKGSDKINGLVVYKLNETTLEDYSHEDTCPNRNFAIEGTCDTDWNSLGTDLLNYDFGYPVFFLTNNTELEQVRNCFSTFNNFSLESHYERSLCSLELNFFMYAVLDTPTCLRRSAPRFNFNTHRVCDPIGSYNIWASLFPIGNSSVTFGNTTHVEKIRDDVKQIVVASRLDATSLFFGKVPGAISPITNVVTLLYTSYLLKQMLPKYEDYEKNVLFVFFTGEAYDYSASQRFLYDMEENKFPDVSNMNDNETASNILPSDINLFIELNQLSLSESLHAHMYEENEELRNFLTILKKYAKNNEMLEISEHTDHIPPASFHTFLRNYPNMTGMILTDHNNASYRNKFYNSIFDSAENLKYEYLNSTDDPPRDSIQQHIANISMVLARSLYEEITHQTAPIPENFNVTVDELLYCYLININCSIHHVVQKKHYQENPFSLYVGVPNSVNIIATFTGLTLAWLTADVVNSSGPCPGNIESKLFQYYNMSRNLTDDETICYRSVMNFTDSTSPAFTIDDYNWTSGKYSSWTESTWQQPSIRMFLRPSRVHENMTIAVGSLTMALSFILVYLIKSRSHILFPAPIEAASPTRC